MKKTVWIFLTVIILSACSQNQINDNEIVGSATTTPTKLTTVTTQAVNQTPTITEEPDNVTISVLLIDHIPGETDDWIDNEVLPAFNLLYPYITVDVAYGNYGDLEKEVDKIISGVSDFDIIQFSSKGNQDLSDYLINFDRNDEMFTGNYIPASLENLTSGEEIFGVPVYSSATSMYCRRDILQEHSFDGNPRSYEGLIRVISEISMVNYLGEVERYGYLSDGGLYSFDEYISLAESLDDVENSFWNETVLKFFFDRYQVSNQISVTDLLSTSDESILESGKIACYWGFQYELTDVSNEVVDVIDITPGLILGNSEPVVLVKTGWFGIPKQSEEVDASIAFIKFFSSSELINQYNQGLNTVPPRIDSWYGYFDEWYFPELLINMLDYGVGFNDFEYCDQFKELFYSEVDKYILGLQDIDTTLVNLFQLTEK